MPPSLATIFLLVLLTSLAHAQTPSPLTYEITAATVHQTDEGTTLALHARLTNHSPADLLIPLWGNASAGDIYRFHILGPDQKPLAAALPVPFPAAIPNGLLAPRKPAPLFSPVQAGQAIDCSLSLGPIGTTQPWFFPAPGEYTLTAELVNSHDAYIDDRAERIHVENAFLGTLTAATIHFTVPKSAAELGFAYFDAATHRVAIIGVDPGGAHARSLKGTTVDNVGHPLPGTLVQITALRASGQGGPGNAGDAGDGIIRRVIDRQLTAPDGSFTFAFLPDGAQSFELLTARPDAYASTRLTLTHDAVASAVPVRLVLNPATLLRGKVLDVGNNPLPAVRVTTLLGEYTQHTVYTDDRGVFETFAATSLQTTFRALPLGTFTFTPDPAHTNDGTWTLHLANQSPPHLAP